MEVSVTEETAGGTVLFSTPWSPIAALPLPALSLTSPAAARTVTVSPGSMTFVTNSRTRLPVMLSEATVSSRPSTLTVPVAKRMSSLNVSSTWVPLGEVSALTSAGRIPST